MMMIQVEKHLDGVGDQKESAFCVGQKRPREEDDVDGDEMDWCAEDGTEDGSLVEVSKARKWQRTEGNRRTALCAWYCEKCAYSEAWIEVLGWDEKKKEHVKCGRTRCRDSVEVLMQCHDLTRAKMQAMMNKKRTCAGICRNDHDKIVSRLED